MEKHRAIKSQIHSVVINQDEITDQNEVNKQIFSFYQSLFSRKVMNQTDVTEAYLELIPLPEHIIEQILSCEGIISDNKGFKSSKSMENNKSPGNNGLSKEFWNEIKNPFLTSIHRAFLNR